MRDRPDHYYSQSAVIPFRKDDEGALELFLITSRKKKRWVIPKGVIELHLDPPVSAAKEAFEEGGIRGHVFASPVGRYDYDKWGGTCTVQVFAMRVEEVMEVWEESFRDREWVTLEEAVSRMEEPALKTILRDFPDWLARGEV